MTFLSAHARIEYKSFNFASCPGWPRACAGEVEGSRFQDLGNRTAAIPSPVFRDLGIDKKSTGLDYSAGRAASTVTAPTAKALEHRHTRNGGMATHGYRIRFYRGRRRHGNGMRALSSVPLFPSTGLPLVRRGQLSELSPPSTGRRGDLALHLNPLKSGTLSPDVPAGVVQCRIAAESSQPSFPRWLQ